MNARSLRTRARSDRRFGVEALGTSILVAMVAAAGCGAEPGTSVRIDLVYDEKWQLDQLDLSFGESEVSIAAAHRVFARLPDDWIDRPMTIEVLGLRGASRVAAATAVVTPVLDREVPVRVTLTRLPCGAWCTPGSTTCTGAGVSECALREDECMEWGPPRPCAVSCSLGTCVSQCVDECAAGETRCDGPDAEATCGQGDGDGCLDWQPATPCDDGASCSNGACRALCADECAVGATRCDGNGVSRCGDLNLDGCLEWGPIVSCTGGATCSGGACSSSCTDDCSASTCEVLNLRTCGQFDLDACRDLSPGRSCVPDDPCRDGACALGACSSVEKSCDGPPSSVCLGAQSVRSYEPRGVCTATGSCEYASHDTVCSTGCTDGACDFFHSNADVLGMWMPTGLAPVIAQGTFDTSSNCRAGSVLGNCTPVTQAVGPEICVCRVDDLTVHGLAVTGTRGLAILAWNDVTVDGLLRMAPGTGIGAVVDPSRRGDGGTYGTQGGTFNGPQISPWGDPSIVPLRGGMSAGSSAGGGALQISARHRIVVTGQVSVPGAGGRLSSSGHGGGSGGSVLLEAPSVTIAGAIAANGGGGGGGDLSGSAGNQVEGTGGQDGRIDMMAAEGGVGSDEYFPAGCGSAHGGSGGRGSIGNSGGAPGQVPNEPCMLLETNGGGGGGAGRIRINASAPCDCSGRLSPTPTFGTQ